jgi:sulfoxide reductase heme-binding subunit YedZ
MDKLGAFESRLTQHLSDRTIRFAVKPVVFAASLLPLALSVWDPLTHRPTNPYNAIVRTTGYWSLRFLCVTIAITPLRWLTKWHALIKFRRMMGLFAFFYGLIHFGVYFLFDHIAAVGVAGHLSPFVAVSHATWDASVEILERPFFGIGFLALAALVPLAATSTASMIRKLGGRRWGRLHRLVYPAAIASVVHTYWPLSLSAPRYVVILVTILLVRLARSVTTRPAQRRLLKGRDPETKLGPASPIPERRDA